MREVIKPSCEARNAAKTVNDDDGINGKGDFNICVSGRD